MIAAYLHEIHDDPLIACQLAKSLGIHDIVISKAWNKNLSEIPDNNLAQIKDNLLDNKLNVLGIYSDSGDTISSKLNLESAKKYFNIARYLSAKFMTINWGMGEYDAKSKWWITTISGMAIDYNTIPLVQFSQHSSLHTAADIVAEIQKYKKWRIIYDPTLFIRSSTIDPFIRYWVLLKKFTHAIDVCDYKVGKGFCPAGTGDGKLIQTINDINSDTYILLKPNLGRKFGSVNSKPEVFKLALATLRSILDDKIK